MRLSEDLLGQVDLAHAALAQAAQDAIIAEGLAGEVGFGPFRVGGEMPRVGSGRRLGGVIHVREFPTLSDRPCPPPRPQDSTPQGAPWPPC